MVLTIIILIILATISINALTGDDGLISQAEKARDMQTNATILEAESINELIVLIEQGGSSEEDYTMTYTGDTISTTTSYCSSSSISYYADVDGDGKVDGIIFADLAIGGSGYWGSTNRNYSYTAVESESLKEYTISENTYTDDYFGEGYVVTPISETTGEDRFYVMDLEDLNSNYYTWYWNGYGNLPSSEAVSWNTNDFGEGLENTEYWLEAYTNEDYGEQYTIGKYIDLWNLTDIIGTNVGDSDSIWFVPSKSEWLAFAKTLGITAENHWTTYGMSDGYWTSTNYSANYVYLMTLYLDCLYSWGTGGTWNVRLCTTF